MTQIPVMTGRSIPISISTLKCQKRIRSHYSRNWLLQLRLSGISFTRDIIMIIRLRPILVMIFMPVMLLITRKIMQEILLTIIILTVGRVKDGNIFIMTVVMSIVVYYELLSLMMSPKDTRMRFI